MLSSGLSRAAFEGGASLDERLAELRPDSALCRIALRTQPVGRVGLQVFFGNWRTQGIQDLLRPMHCARRPHNQPIDEEERDEQRDAQVLPELREGRFAPVLPVVLLALMSNFPPFSGGASPAIKGGASASM